MVQAAGAASPAASWSLGGVVADPGVDAANTLGEQQALSPARPGLLGGNERLPAAQLHATRIVLPENLSKPSLTGIGFGAPIGMSTVLRILGEALVRDKLPPSLKNLTLDQLQALDARVAVFLAAPPDTWTNPESFSKRAGLFMSITLPGAKASWILILSPGQDAIQVGRGRSFPVLNGAGLILTNAYAGASNLSPNGSGPVNRANTLFAPLLRVPFSKTLQNTVATGLQLLGDRLALASVAAAPKTGGASIIAGTRLKLLLSVLSTLIKTPTFYIGPAYGVSVIDDKKEGLSVQRGNRPARDIEHFGEEFAAIFKGYSVPDGGLNGGDRSTAISHIKWYLERSTSVFQIAAVSESRNHGLPWLALLNKMNAMLQKHGLLERRVPELPPGRLRDVPDSEYVVMLGTLRNGQHATQLLGQLKSYLLRVDPQAWAAFVADIRPLAQQYQLNFGLTELRDFIGPQPRYMKPEDREIRDYFLRDWNKGETQEQRRIVPVPKEFRFYG